MSSYYGKIVKLITRLIKQKKKEFNRFLPLGDYFIDRWKKAQMLGFGKGTSIYDSSLVMGDVFVGDNCWIGPFTILDGSGTLKIGNNCVISAGVHIYTHDTVDACIYGKPIQRESVTIGNNCYIGPHSVIVKGVTLGNFVIVGAHSFVNKDIASYSKVFGIPAIFREKVNCHDNDS